MNIEIRNLDGEHRLLDSVPFYNTGVEIVHTIRGCDEFEVESFSGFSPFGVESLSRRSPYCFESHSVLSLF